MTLTTKRFFVYRHRVLIAAVYSKEAHDAVIRLLGDSQWQLK